MMELDRRLPAMSLAVVGVDHLNKDGSDRRFEILLCKPGEPVELVLEPKNKKDRNAVAVFSARGVQLGYITAERAPRVGGILRSGREVHTVFQRVAPWGAWIRAAFDGETPVVAAELPAIAAGDDDNFPDEHWSETFE